MEKNDDNLYEEMERFILYLQEGGADAAQSDELKMLKNPAYHNAFTRSGKISGRILLIAGGAELLLLAFCFRQDQLLFFFTGSDCLCAQKDPRPDLDLSELWLPASFDLFSFFSYH